jgi:hypothetical protein
MTKLLVPLYIWIGDQTEIMQAIDTMRKGDIAIVTGPDSGCPDAAESTELRAVVDKFHVNGVSVVGYVSTKYGQRPLHEIQDEMVSWRILTGVDGIFFDETFIGAHLGDFRSLNGLPRSWRRHQNTWISNDLEGKKGLSVFNPGRWEQRVIDLQRRLPGSIWNVWEGDAERYAQEQPQVHRFPEREAHIIYRAGNSPVVSPPSLGYRYVTVDDLPNPFDTFQG